MLDWHAQTIPHILHEFNTDIERGLTRDAASARRQRYGDNEIDSPRGSRLPLLFLKQIANIPVLLLAVTAAVLWYSKHDEPRSDRESLLSWDSMSYLEVCPSRQNSKSATIHP